MLKSKIALLSVLLMSIALFSSVTVAQAFVTISGNVSLDDGTPVEGVEVFLGIFTDPFEARYTCTDAEGNYEFTEVPDVDLISAVGPDVDDAEICASPYFTDSSNHPLVISFYDGGRQSSELDTFTSADSPINYTLSLWDTGGNRALRNLIIGAHRIMSEDFSGGDLARFYTRMDFIIRFAGRLGARGRISAASEASVIDHATNYLGITN